jgi:hypothetical protein
MELFSGAPHSQLKGRLASSHIFPHFGQKNFSKRTTSSSTVVQYVLCI